jgi:hypothetical protein
MFITREMLTGAPGALVKETKVEDFALKRFCIENCVINA